MAIPGMGGNTITTTFVARNQMSSTVNQIRKDVASLGGPKFGPIGNLVSGFTSMTSGAFLAAGGVAAVAGALTGAVKSSIDEERNIAKLNAALEANVAGWDGNIAAVERTIAARERLAFSDDDLRQSLALLVPATKDVNEALRLQAIAMDLSRLRGTDLAETSTLIAKVSQGNLSSLKRFGITLDKNASSTEALAKIQQLAGGQAQAYAATTAGALEVMDIAASDLSEDIGKGLTPIVETLARKMTDIISPAHSAGSALAEITAEMDKQVSAARELRQSLPGSGGDKSIVGLIAVEEHLMDFDQLLGRNNKAIHDFQRDFGAALGTGEGDIRDFVNNAQELGWSLDEIRSKLAEKANGSWWITSLADHVKRENADLRALAPEVSAAAQDLYDPVATQARLAAERASHWMTEMPKFAVSGIKSGLADIRAVMFEFKHNLIDPLSNADEIAFIEAKLASKAVQRGMKSHNPQIKADTAALVQWLKTKLAELNGIDISISAHTQQMRDLKSRGGRYGARAMGGPVSPDEAYTVGERGPETLVMGNRGGSIIPNGGSRQPLHVHVNVNGRQVAEAIVDDIDRIHGKRQSYQRPHTNAHGSKLW
jgi:hypothetical protein